jgi:Tfp pilus assembly protein PilZ
MSSDEPKPDPRVSVHMRARISTIDAETDPFSGKSFFRTSDETCANVSRGGAFVPMRETIPPGRRVLVELELPGGQHVQAIGRVAWTRTSIAAAMPAGKGRASGIGIQFVAGTRDDLGALERFVDRSLRPTPSTPEAGPSFAPEPG